MNELKLKQSVMAELHLIRKALQSIQADTSDMASSLKVIAEQQGEGPSNSSTTEIATILSEGLENIARTIEGWTP